MDRFYHGRGVTVGKTDIKRNSVSGETVQFWNVFDASNYFVIYVVCT